MDKCIYGQQTVEELVFSNTGTYKNYALGSDLILVG